MEDAVIKERIRENPVKKVKAPKGAQPGEEINPLNEEQVPVFLEQAKNRHYALWLTFLGTGCRPEDLLGLKRSKLDLRSKTVTVSEVVVCDNGRMIPQPIPKTDKSRRTIKISNTVVDALKAHLEEVDAWKQKVGPKLFKDIGLVFPSETGGYLNPSNLARRHFKPILREAGLPDIRPYDLSYPHLNKIRTFSKELPNQRKSQEKGSDNKSLFHRANAAVRGQAAVPNVLGRRYVEFYGAGQVLSTKLLFRIVGHLVGLQDEGLHLGTGPAIRFGDYLGQYKENRGLMPPALLGYSYPATVRLFTLLLLIALSCSPGI